MGSTCPDGRPHHWQIPTKPDIKTRLYPSKCRNCGEEVGFISSLPEPEGFRCRPKKTKKDLDVNKNKGGSRGGKHVRDRGWNFRNPDILRERIRENKERKPEIIETYLNTGTYYQTAKDLCMPRNTIRQLIIKWEKAGDVDKVRHRLKMATVLGEIVNLDKSDDSVIATVTFTEHDLIYLRLGKVEMHFISQEIMPAMEEKPGAV